MTRPLSALDHLQIAKTMGIAEVASLSCKSSVWRTGCGTITAHLTFDQVSGPSPWQEGET